MRDGRRGRPSGRGARRAGASVLLPALQVALLANGCDAGFSVSESEYRARECARRGGCAGGSTRSDASAGGGGGAGGSAGDAAAADAASPLPLAWAWAPEATSATIESVVVGTDGHVYFAGTYKGRIVIGSESHTSAHTDLFLASFTSSGSIRWSRGGFAASSGVSLVGLAAAGNEVCLAGGFSTPLDFGGAALAPVDGGTVSFAACFRRDTGDATWARRLDELQVRAITGSDTIYLAGTFGPRAELDDASRTSSGPSDAFLARLGATHYVTWVTSWGGPGADEAFAAAASAGPAPSVATLTWFTPGDGGASALRVDRIATSGAGSWSSTALSALPFDVPRWRPVVAPVGKGIAVAGALREHAQFASRPLQVNLCPDGVTPSEDAALFSLGDQGAELRALSVGDAYLDEFTAIAPGDDDTLFVGGAFERFFSEQYAGCCADCYGNPIFCGCDRRIDLVVGGYVAAGSGYSSSWGIRSQPLATSVTTLATSLAFESPHHLYVAGYSTGPVRIDGLGWELPATDAAATSRPFLLKIDTRGIR